MVQHVDVPPAHGHPRSLVARAEQARDRGVKVTPMERLDIPDLLDRVRWATGGTSPFDVPVVLVDCSAAPPAAFDPVALAAQISTVPAVLVAVDADAHHPVADVLDLDATQLADPGGIDRLVKAIEANPIASIALALLLRGGEARSVGEGLVAESSTYSLLQAGPEHKRWLGEQPARVAATVVSSVPAALGASADDDAVLIERTGDDLRLTLNRPDVHNAFSASMRDALIDALAIAGDESAVQVTLAGAGPSFCSGGDLTEFGTRADPATAHLVRLRYNVGRVLAALADRVTVHVHGACVGAGVELPAFAHRVVAQRDARFWLPEVALGLVPGAGGTVSIPRRIGRRRTAELALLGEPIDAPTALAWGLVDELVD